MMHSKNHNPGFTLLEVMFALALLSIFGTSLFMMQSTIFSKVSKAHNRITGLINLEALKVNFDLKYFNAQQSNQPVTSLSDSKDFGSMKATLNLKPIPEKSMLHAPFARYIKILDHTATFDTRQEKFIAFMFIPPAEEAKEETS